MDRALSSQPSTLNRDPDLAAVDIQNRVNTAQGRLPSTVKANGISIAKARATSCSGPPCFRLDGRLDPLFISNYLDVYVSDALKRVKGVADVIIFGERKYAMRLWLDPVRMAAADLTAGDVVNALREQNVQVAAGQVGQPPAQPSQKFQISVRAIGRLSEPAIRQHHRQDEHRRHAGTPEGCGPRRSWARKTTAPICNSTARMRWAWASHSCRTPTRSKWTGDAHCGTGTALQAVPAGHEIPAGLRHHRRRRRVNPRRAEHAGAKPSCWWCW